MQQNKNSETQEKPSITSLITEFFEKRTERISTLEKGIKEIETVAKVASIFEKLRLPIDKLLKTERRIFERMIDELGWSPRIGVKINGKTIPLAFPFELRQAFTAKGDIAVMRDSPAHGKLPNKINDTYAIDFLCPPGTPVYALANGWNAPQTQNGKIEFGNGEEFANADNRVYASQTRSRPMFIWCVRHMAPATPEIKRRLEIAKGTGYNQGEVIGETGFSGGYADNPPRCHLHIAVYQLNEMQERDTWVSLPIKLLP